VHPTQLTLKARLNTARMFLFNIEISERRAILARYNSPERRRKQLDEAVHSQVFWAWLKTCQRERGKLPRCDFGISDMASR
jgi:hypothetical protein